ncbi:MAG: hypothetical protein HRT45_15510 [Bdellovibrionales bacterium]|nr:hypothetical protein [Bdellovibrionales bacterium]
MYLNIKRLIMITFVINLSFVCSAHAFMHAVSNNTFGGLGSNVTDSGTSGIGDSSTGDSDSDGGHGGGGSSTGGHSDSSDDDDGGGGWSFSSTTNNSFAETSDDDDNFGPVTVLNPTRGATTNDFGEPVEPVPASQLSTSQQRLIAELNRRVHAYESLSLTEKRFLARKTRCSQSSPAGLSPLTFAFLNKCVGKEKRARWVDQISCQKVPRKTRPIC